MQCAMLFNIISQPRALWNRKCCICNEIQRRSTALNISPEALILPFKELEMLRLGDGAGL